MRQTRAIARAARGPAASIEQVVRLPRARRDLLIRNGARWCTAGMARSLAERAFSLRCADVSLMLDLASAAADILQRLPLGGDALRELSVFVLAHQGNALRIAGEFASAADRFEAAERAWSADCCTSAVRALLLEFRASLEESRRRFTRALTFLDEAAEIHQAGNDLERLAKVYCQRGIIFSYAEQPEQAIVWLRRAVVSVQRDRDLARAIFQSLMWALVAAGRHSEAASILDRSRDLLAGGAELYQLKLGWLRGRMAVAAGALESAHAEFSGARAAYGDRGMLQEAAAVSLDLALLEWSCGRSSDASLIVAETEPLFVALGIEREVLATRLLRSAGDAARAERIARELLARLETGAAFQRGRPGLRHGR